MEQVIFGGANTYIPGSGTKYNSLVSGSAWRTAEFNGRGVVSTSGKIKNLRVKTSGAPGAGKSWIFTLMVNGVGSALTLTIADTATSGADTTHEVDVVAGDTVSLGCEAVNYPADEETAVWTSMFEGATPKESLILGETGISTLSNTADEYAQVMGQLSYGPEFEEARFRQVCPTSGKIKSLYVELSEDPGTSPNAYRFTLRKNGVSQTLTVTITADDTTGNDTAHEVTVVAGDVLTLLIEPLNTPSATPTANWGMTFVADTDGESVILASTGPNTPRIDTTSYAPLQSSSANDWDTTESKRYNLGQSCTLKKLYMLLSGAPGAGKSYAFTVRINAADGNLTVTISDAATTGNDTVHTDSISDDDYVDLESTPTNTPAAAYSSWGLVCFIEPAVGLENKSANMAAKMVAAGLI